MTVERIVESGRVAVVQWTLEGTMKGTPFHGILASGRPLRLRGVDVIRFDDADCIEENTIYFDGADFARQLGMLPRQNSTADRAMLGLFNTTVRLRNLVRRERGR